MLEAVLVGMGFGASSSWLSAADGLISVVTNRLHSDGYRTALHQFLGWHVSTGGGPLSRALIQRYRVTLEARNLAPWTINQHLSALRSLADECAESGLLDQPTAAANRPGQKRMRPRRADWQLARGFNPQPR